MSREAGGPGIVVASTAFAAGIISRPFYAVLVRNLEEMMPLSACV